MKANWPVLGYKTCFTIIRLPAFVFYFNLLQLCLTVQNSTMFPNMETKARSQSATMDQSMPIAIVGMGCRLPGSATSPEKLWDMLIGKESARSETPSDRFNIDAFNHPDNNRNGTVSNMLIHVQKCGF